MHTTGQRRVNLLRMPPEYRVVRSPRRRNRGPAPLLASRLAARFANTEPNRLIHLLDRFSNRTAYRRQHSARPLVVLARDRSSVRDVGPIEQMVARCPLTGLRASDGRASPGGVDWSPTLWRHGDRGRGPRHQKEVIFWLPTESAWAWVHLTRTTAEGPLNPSTGVLSTWAISLSNSTMQVAVSSQRSSSQ
jgi:hypothetical protein